MADIFGEIQNPFRPKSEGGLGVESYAGEIGEGTFGLLALMNNLLKLVVVIAGLFAFFNLIVAGYQFMTAMGDPKGITAAWNKIWQSLIGLLIVAGSFALAAIFGWLLLGDPLAILNPQIYGPGTPLPPSGP
jgi:hypothetical protein